MYIKYKEYLNINLKYCISHVTAVLQFDGKEMNNTPLHYIIWLQVDTWVCQKNVLSQFLNCYAFYYKQSTPWLESLRPSAAITPQPLPVLLVTAGILQYFIGNYVPYYGHVIGNFNTRPPIIKSLLSTAIDLFYPSSIDRFRCCKTSG